MLLYGTQRLGVHWVNMSNLSHVDWTSIHFYSYVIVLKPGAIPCVIARDCPAADDRFPSSVSGIHLGPSCCCIMHAVASCTCNYINALSGTPVFASALNTS